MHIKNISPPQSVASSESITVNKSNLLGKLYTQMEKQPQIIKPVIRELIEYRYQKSRHAADKGNFKNDCVSRLDEIFKENGVEDIDAKKLFDHLTKRGIMGTILSKKDDKTFPKELDNLLRGRDSKGYDIKNAHIDREIRTVIKEKASENAEIEIYLYDFGIKVNQMSDVTSQNLLKQGITNALKSNSPTVNRALVLNLLEYAHQIEKEGKSQINLIDINQIANIEPNNYQDLTKYVYLSNKEVLQILNDIMDFNPSGRKDASDRFVANQVYRTIQDIIQSDNYSELKNYLLEKIQVNGQTEDNVDVTETGLSNFNKPNISTFFFDNLFSKVQQLPDEQFDNIFYRNEKGIYDIPFAELIKKFDAHTFVNNTVRLLEDSFLPSPLLTYAAAIAGKGCSEISAEVKGLNLGPIVANTFSDKSSAYNNSDYDQHWLALQMLLNAKEIPFKEERIAIVGDPQGQVDSKINDFIASSVQNNRMFIVSFDNVRAFGYKDPNGNHQFYDLQYDNPLLDQLFVKTPIAARRDFQTGNIFDLESYGYYRATDTAEPSLTLMAIDKVPDQTTLARLAKARVPESNGTVITRQTFQAGAAVGKGAEEYREMLQTQVVVDINGSTFSVGSMLADMIDKRICLHYRDSSYNALFPANADSKNAELMGKFV